MFKRLFLRNRINKRKYNIKRGGINMSVLSKPNRNIIMINQSDTQRFIEDSKKAMEDNKKYLSKCQETSKLFKRKF